MVENFFEDNSEKHSSSTGAVHRSSDDDELNFFLDSSTPNSSPIDSSFILKSLIPCASTMERNMLTEIASIIETNKASSKRKDEMRKIVVKKLTALGYDASVCKSKWEKSSSIPSGEYEYVDVIIDGGDRLIIDVDFRSEFEIARSTTSYRSILHNLPSIFVGKGDRLRQILAIVAEAARLSLKKEGMHIAPWRKAEYMKSKWLGPYTRIAPLLVENDGVNGGGGGGGDPEVEEVCLDYCCGLIFGSETEMTTLSVSEGSSSSAGEVTWKVPTVRDGRRRNKGVVTGLASLLKEIN